MKCNCCGKDLGEFTFDIAFQLPDAIWALSEAERQQRAQFDSDLSRLDDRYFIRGVAFVPVQGTDRQFGWGIWVEIPPENFFHYAKNFNSDNRGTASFSGKAANRLLHYPDTCGITMQVQLGDQTQRPIFTSTDPQHPLTLEQANGIPLERVHAYNDR